MTAYVNVFLHVAHLLALRFSPAFQPKLERLTPFDRRPQVSPPPGKSGTAIPRTSLITSTQTRKSRDGIRHPARTRTSCAHIWRVDMLVACLSVVARRSAAPIYWSSTARVGARQAGRKPRLLGPRRRQCPLSRPTRSVYAVAQQRWVIWQYTRATAAVRQSVETCE